MFALNIPNPVTAPRLKSVDEDPYGCLSYSSELTKKPEFTVGLISDPQFARERSRETLIQKAVAGVEDLNRRKPDLVIICIALICLIFRF